MKIEELNKLTREELEKRVKWYDKNYGPYYETRGLHNWKNLFRKPTNYEWLILVIIILIIFAGFAYNSDIKTCRETLENIPEEVCEACIFFQENLNKHKGDALEEFNYSLILEKLVND